MSRTIDYLPLADLAPDPRNPKDHDVGLIHTSVGRFGFVEPIVLDSRTGLIVSGHGRVKALTALEAEGGVPPEGITVDEVTGRWRVPVVTGWASSSDVDAAAALIAMNRTTEMGGWVDESLLDLLSQLADTDGLDGVGYDADNLEVLRKIAEGPDFSDLENDPAPSGHSSGQPIEVECPNCGHDFEV